MNPVIFLICSATPPGKVDFLADCNSTESTVGASTDPKKLERASAIDLMVRRFVRGSICSVPFVEAAFQFQRAAFLMPLAPTGVIAKRTVKKALICALVSDLLLDTRMQSALWLVLALVVMVMGSVLAAAWEPIRLQMLSCRAPGRAALRRVLYLVLILELVTDPRVQRAFFALLFILPAFLCYLGVFVVCIYVLNLLRPHTWRLWHFIASWRQLRLEQVTERRIMAILQAEQAEHESVVVPLQGDSIWNSAKVKDTPIIHKGAKMFSASLQFASHRACSLARQSPAHPKSSAIKNAAVLAPKVSSLPPVSAHASVVSLLGQSSTMLRDVCSEVSRFAKAPAQRRERPRRSMTPEKGNSFSTESCKTETAPPEVKGQRREQSRRSMTPEKAKSRKTETAAPEVEGHLGCLVVMEEDGPVKEVTKELQDDVDLTDGGAAKEITKARGVESMLLTRVLQLIRATTKHRWCTKVLRFCVPF